MHPYATPSFKETVAGNTYPGRGIVIGKSADGRKAVVAYFIMGRSENSRNRVFIEQGEEVVIHPFDPSKVKDPSLIIYSPIRVIDNKLIVTNGDQTDTVYEFLRQGRGFSEALETRCFEPDAPNFTPRISGMLTFDEGDFTYLMSILKSVDEEGSDCQRFTFAYPSKAGLGHFLHTYVRDGSPIPSFQGEPERVAIPDDIDAFTSEIWDSLDENNRVSLYVRYIDLASGEAANRMINRNGKDA